MARLAHVLVLLAACAALAGAQPNRCIQLGGPLFQICKPELDAVQAIYPLSSTTPITDAQVSQVLATAQTQNLPTPACCERAKAFDAASCACDPVLPGSLKAVGVSATSVGLQSSSKFTSQACDFQPVPCVAPQG